MNSESIDDANYDDEESSHQEHLFRGYNSPTHITLAAPKTTFRPQSAQISGQKRRANPQTDTFEVRSSMSASRHKPSITLEKTNKKSPLPLNEKDSVKSRSKSIASLKSQHRSKSTISVKLGSNPKHKSYTEADESKQHQQYSSESDHQDLPSAD